MRSRKFSIIAIVFACVLGISMISTGVLAATGVLNFSGTVSVTITSSITYDIGQHSAGSWSNGTWSLSMAQGESATTTFTLDNTYASGQWVDFTADTSGGISANWADSGDNHFTGSAYVAVGTTTWTLTVYASSEATGGSISVGISQ